MTGTTKKLLIGLLEPMIRTFGTSRSLVQIPALMVRRFILLSILALGGLVILFTGLSLLLSGLLELSEIMGTTWVFSVAVGSMVALVGFGALLLALRREIWTRPVDDPRVSTQPHPLETVALMAIELIEEYQAQRKAQMEAQMHPTHTPQTTHPTNAAPTSRPQGPDASWSMN